MAKGGRKYVRDNRGRFASVGATARGGRLKTAGGNKRATVKTKSGQVLQGRLTGAPLKNTIGKTADGRFRMSLSRPSKPGQRQAYNEARTALTAAKPAQPKPRPATRQRYRIGPMGPRQKEALASAQGDLQVRSERLAFARKAKKQAKGPLEKLNATSRINEHSLGVSQAKDKITLVKSQAVVGRPIAGKDRFGNSMRARKARRPNAIRGKVARDPSVGSKVKGLDPNAGKYRRVYAHNANKAAQAANRRRK